MKQKEKYQIKKGNPEWMGAVVLANGVNFTVELPGGKETELLIYEKNGENPVLVISMIPELCTGDVGSVFVEGLSGKGCEYVYRTGGVTVKDPYALMISGERCVVVEEYGQAVVTNDQPWIPFENLVLYKLHIKGFTKQAKVRKKGTFQGVKEQIPYLKELGINGVEFMPIYEWNDSLRPVNMSVSYYPCPEPETVRKNYWGYAPVNYYFAPKSVYASTGKPVKECADMINAFHEAGIECIMEIYFPGGTVPTLAVDVLRYWKMNYGIDGFHLIGDGVPVEAIVRHPLFTRTKLFFDRVDEAWIYGNKEPVYRNIAEYNNDFMDCSRRLLKGDDSQISNFVYQSRKNPQKHGAVNYMANVNGFTMMDMVSYDRKHNEENGEENRDGMPANDVWNCGAEGPTRKASVRALRKKQLKNAFLYVLLAQGTPLIYQGDEWGNSQMGNNNAYASDNEIGWVNWKKNPYGEELLAFVKEAIAFRKAHPILHMNKEMRLTDYRAYGYPDLSYHDERAWYTQFESSNRFVGAMYCGKFVSMKEEEQDDFIYVAYNAYWEKQTFSLPKLPTGMKWQMAIYTDDQDKEFYPTGKPLLEQRKVEVAERSVMVLLGKKAEAEENQKTKVKLKAKARQNIESKRDAEAEQVAETKQDAEAEQIAETKQDAETEQISEAKQNAETGHNP
ncbi:MAG: alpha-amylase family glycosyl hydrolase [Lachnospiraceae bacterium]|nr:alpha-amylase family glycosyl hydrolase [Lachnospiraceae bacterium]